MNDNEQKPAPETQEAPGLGATIKDLFKGLKKKVNGEPSARETLEELIEEREESEAPIDEQERRLLANILRMKDVTVHDVMVPRADIVAVPATLTLPELKARFAAEGHSRMPIYRGNLDDVVGMIHIKDVLAALDSDKTVTLRHLLRKVLFVSPSMQVLDLLLEMRLKRTHMALVVDEYGGIDGLATIEDLVEQIVGEIEDEHDTSEDLVVKKLEPHLYEADARLLLEDFEKELGPVLSSEEREDIDTLGGLVIALAGHVPARGELIEHPSGIEFEVLEADPRRIKRLKIRTPAPATGDEAG